jgi:putative flippase GtrA
MAALVGPKLLRFLLSGFPGFLLAVGLNWLLVSVAKWPIPAAYASVLLCQLTLNYFLCRRFVFPAGSPMSVLRQYAHFVAGIGLFRLLDWMVYTAATGLLHVPFMLAQLANVAIFSVLKFRFAESLFEGPRERLG